MKLTRCFQAYATSALLTLLAAAGAASAEPVTI